MGNGDLKSVTCACGKIVDIDGEPECIIYGTSDGRQAWWHGCSNPKHPGQALVFGGYCETRWTYSIDEGDNQLYMNPESRNVYSWDRSSGEPVSSHKGCDRLILCIPEDVAVNLAQWLSEHEAELEDILALWDEERGRWLNGNDETTLAIQRLQDVFNEALLNGEITSVED